MTSEEILARLGWGTGTLELVAQLPPPPDSVARGYVAAVGVDLPPLHLAAPVESSGITSRRFLGDARCIALDGVPRESGGTVHPLDGGIALDTRHGFAWALYQVDGGSYAVAYADDGELHILRVVDSFTTRMSADLTRPKPLQVEFPSLDALAEAGPTPQWLVQTATARWSDEPTDKLEAIGLFARHGRSAATALARAWCRAMSAGDVAYLESQLNVEVESAYDLLELVIRSGSPNVMARLVLRRDRLASLAAIRSFVGVGGGIHESLRILDEEIAEHLLHLPAPERVGLANEESLRAAGEFDPDAWWSDYGR